MTILTVKDLLKTARRIRGNYGGPLVYQLEDIEAQLELWIKDPASLTKDEALQKGVVFLSKILLGAEGGG